MKKRMAIGRMSTGSNFKKLIFTSSDELHKLTAYIWIPTDKPVCGIVQIIHGMREHMGRYADFAAFLNAKGYVVCGHDHLGHGESAKASGTYGYFGADKGAGLLVSDSYRMTKVIRKMYPDIPLFLFGHSMGSFIGRIYITRYSKDLSGFICVGTGEQRSLYPVVRALAWGLSKSGYDEKPGNILDRIAFKAFNDHFPYEESKLSWLSRDVDVVKAFENDEHTKSQLTYGGFSDLLDLQMAACGKKWAKRVPDNLPILLVSGTEDPVGDYGKGVAKVYEQLKKSGVMNVFLKMYTGARHEVLNEINKEEVYFDIYCWIEENKFER